MKKLFLSFMMTLSYVVVFGQSALKDMPQTTLYEIGGITSCEDNFKNLTTNFTDKFVKNATDFQILSCHFVENLNSESKVKRYYKFLCGKNAIFGEVMLQTTTESKTDAHTQATTSSGQVSRTIVLKDLLKTPMTADEMNQYRQITKSKLTKDLAVYVVKFRYVGKEYATYVFCDPNSKRVVLDYVFNIPVYNFEL